MDALTNGVTITVIDTGNSYHSLTDLGLAIGNNNYIGTPEYETHYVKVPGRQGLVDLSEAVTGHLTYNSRPISIEFGGKWPRNEWANRLSVIRSRFHGKNVKLVFDDDPYYYYTGRAIIEDFDRFRDLGTFKFSIPEADPFKYSIRPTTQGPRTVTSSSSWSVYVTVTVGDKGPYIKVQSMSGGPLVLSHGGITRNITANGTYTFGDVSMPGQQLLAFRQTTGSSIVTITTESGVL